MAIRTILRRPQVEAATGLGRSQIYALIAEGEFPRPVQLTAQAVGWFSDEVAEWQERRQRTTTKPAPRDRKRRTSAPEAA